MKIKSNRWKKKVLLAASTVLTMCSLSACGKVEEEVVSNLFSGFAKNELFRINDASCTMPEYMVYLTNIQNQYEHVYGSEIWDVALGTVTLEDNVKETVLAKIAQIKTMELMAESKGVVLTEEQESKVLAAAAEYFGSLSEAEVAALMITQEEIADLYKEYALANMVYQQIIDSVDPEISDDEARTITVDQIHMKTYTIDSQGTRMEFSDYMRAEVEEDMYDIHEFATKDGRDFTELANKYNEADTVRWSFRKGEVDPAVEEAGFALSTGEVSQVIVTEDGYYLLKCISTYDKEQTDANKEIIIQQRKDEAFGKEYDAFVASLSKKINETLWQGIELMQDESVDTDDFFEIYEKYLQ